MELVSLAIDKKKLEEKQAERDAPCEPEIPKYPWGTSINLDGDTIAALGLKEMPQTGTVFKITGVVKVTGTSDREYETGKGVEKRQTLDLQITDMGLEGAKKQTFKEAASTLYSKGK